MIKQVLGASLMLLLALAVAVDVQGQQRARQIDVTRLGPQVGDVVPDFRLQDSQGKTWTRDGLIGANGAMLVFSRSIDGCAYCTTQTLDLQGRLPELRAKGLGLAVITRDSPEVLAEFARRRGVTYPLLSDPGSRTIRSYGILNTTVDESSTNFGIPFPGMFILNRQGAVRARFFEPDYQERTTVSSILVSLGAGSRPAAAPRVVTDHIELTSYATDDVVAPGALFSLVFDVRLRERMHVYAPGAKDYRVIAFNLEPNPLLVTRPMRYPPSELYVLEPLTERVPVFQKPFRLMQSVGLSTAQEHRRAVASLDALIIKGRLEYQACDDRICFMPKSIPVSFSVKVRPLDGEPANVGR
jgi:peroxiredoxin